MTTQSAFTVGELARLAGITVRTLHHYDEIGLVSPMERTTAGYRTYGRAEVERLQEVLFFKQLGFGLDEIGRLIAETGIGREDQLIRQRELLYERLGRLNEIVTAVDRAIAAERTGVMLKPEEMLEVFGDFDPAAYRDEAEERWGHTPEYAESTRRVASYTKRDWLEIQQEADAINQGLIDLMAADVPPESEQATALAEQHREHITKWFYECTPEIHAGLGRMYVSDPRFKKSIDEAGEGLAEFMSAAIAANAARGT